MKGRGVNAQHRKKTEAEEDSVGGGKVPRVSINYFFLITKDEEAKDNPMIGMVDESTGEKYARAAGKKGVGTDGEMD